MSGNLESLTSFNIIMIKYIKKKKGDEREDDFGSKFY